MSDRRYFVSIPNIVLDLDLSENALRLYMRIKRVAGDAGGECGETIETLARSAHMGKAVAIAARAELAIVRPELGNRPLIEVVEARRVGTMVAHKMRVVDVWPENMAKYSAARPVLDGTGRFQSEPVTGSNQNPSPVLSRTVLKEQEQEQREEGSFAYAQEPAVTADTADNGLTVSADYPPPPPVQALGFSDALAAAVMDATGWTDRLKNGGYPSWLRRCLGILGRASGGDADAATALLAAIVAHERWAFRPMSRADQFPTFLQSMVKELAAADPAVTATGAMLARRCGIDLEIAGAKERRAFEDIARAGLATGRTPRELDAVIADARREPRFAACGIPAWRLRQGLAALPVAVPR